jgi:hypothetical protein
MPLREKYVSLNGYNSKAFVSNVIPDDDQMDGRNM